MGPYEAELLVKMLSESMIGSTSIHLIAPPSESATLLSNVFPVNNKFFCKDAIKKSYTFTKINFIFTQRKEINCCPLISLILNKITIVER